MLVVLGGATAITWDRQIQQEDTSANPTSQQTSTNHDSITSAEERSRKSTVQPVSYKGESGKNALELLKTQAVVVTQDSAYGPFVDSINGVQGGTNGKYWAFYVNGKQSNVGANDYVTQDGDTLEWKFE